MANSVGSSRAEDGQSLSQRCLAGLNEVHSSGGSFFPKRTGMPIFERAGRLGVKNCRSIARPPGRDFALQESTLDHGVLGLRLEHEGASGRKGNSEHVENESGLFRHPARIPGRIPDDAAIGLPTPGTLDTAFCTIIGSSCADGQLGEVSDMSTFTVRSSPISIR